MFTFAKTKNKMLHYKTVFSTAEGKEVLRDLMDFCCMTKPTYVAGDQYQTAYNEGMRRVGLRIGSFLQMQESDLRKILKEFNNEEVE